MSVTLSHAYHAVRHRLHPLRVFYSLQKARLLPFLIPLWERLGHPVFLHTPAGTIRLVPRGSAAITVLANGFYEREVMAYLTEHLDAGGIFLDVGANAGLFTLSLARARPQAQVYAFEPAKQTFALLEKNIALNGLANVRAIRAALADQDGQATLSLNGPNRDGLNTLLSPASLPPARALRSSAGTETVPVMTLDGFLEREGVGHVSVIKIDVEGAEALVLQGASRLLAQSPAPAIVFECWPDHDQAAVHLLTQHGYVVDDLTDEIKAACKPPHPT